MNWLQKISQTITDVDVSGGEGVASQYFDVGHGDYNPDYGEPAYVVWIYRDNQILTSGVMLSEGNEDEDREIVEENLSQKYNIHGPAGTHGSIWGHDVAELTWKGRYEPETGRMSIVKPHRGGWEQRDVPEVVWKSLRRKFNNIQDVKMFS